MFVLLTLVCVFGIDVQSFVPSSQHDVLDTSTEFTCQSSFQATADSLLSLSGSRTMVDWERLTATERNWLSMWGIIEIIPSSKSSHGDSENSLLQDSERHLRPAEVGPAEIDRWKSRGRTRTVAPSLDTQSTFTNALFQYPVRGQRGCILAAADQRPNLILAVVGKLLAHGAEHVTVLLGGTHGDTNETTQSLPLQINHPQVTVQSLTRSSGTTKFSFVVTLFLLSRLGLIAPGNASLHSYFAPFADVEFARTVDCLLDATHGRWFWTGRTAMKDCVRLDQGRVFSATRVSLIEAYTSMKLHDVVGWVTEHCAPYSGVNTLVFDRLIDRSEARVHDKLHQTANRILTVAGMMGGLNNGVKWLFKAISLARITNRTLVVANFIETDPQHGYEYVPVSLLFDMSCMEKNEPVLFLNPLSSSWHYASTCDPTDTELSSLLHSDVNPAASCLHLSSDTVYFAKSNFLPLNSSLFQYFSPPPQVMEAIRRTSFFNGLSDDEIFNQKKRNKKYAGVHLRHLEGLCLKASENSVPDKGVCNMTDEYLFQSNRLIFNGTRLPFYLASDKQWPPDDERLRKQGAILPHHSLSLPYSTLFDIWMLVLADIFVPARKSSFSGTVYKIRHHFFQKRNYFEECESGPLM